ncbi:MAG: formate/nitrite transporter family protein [Paludibacter sp.]|jgi:formate/nitrite transporter|nr:formate/nitrite transporter family protein [Paludibacter sp.]
MNYLTPKELVAKATEGAVSRSETSVSKTLVLAFMAGAYIALGGLLAVMVGGGVPGIAASNPGIQKFLMGAVFPLGLMLCAIAGADLFTGNTAYFIPPVMSGRLKVTQLMRNWSLVYFGNFIGALFVAYFMTYLSGLFDASPWNDSILGIAEAKTGNPFYKTFLKGIGANWLVALAMWLSFASKDVIGKLAAIWFPVMAFVTMGYEHSVANMFFIPTAIFYGSPVSWSEFLVSNLLPATLGNIVGGGGLVGLLYWYVYDRS